MRLAEVCCFMEYYGQSTLIIDFNIVLCLDCSRVNDDRYYDRYKYYDIYIVIDIMVYNTIYILWKILLYENILWSMDIIRRDIMIASNQSCNGFSVSKKDDYRQTMSYNWHRLGTAFPARLEYKVTCFHIEKLGNHFELID